VHKDFRQHLQWFRSKLETREPFAFARYSDGELYILQNKKLVLDDNLIQIDDRVSTGPYQPQDFKSFDPQLHADVRDHLLRAFQHKQYNYFKGISCRCCVGDAAFDEQIALHGGDDDSLTWANLFVNANYPAFVESVLPVLQTYSTTMVCHHDAELTQLGFVDNSFRVGYNAMVNDRKVIEDIRGWIRQHNIHNHLFLFSASTFSNLAIFELYRDYPDNTYLDIGTCLTPFMKMPMERSYLQEYWFKKGGSDLNRVCVW